MASTIVKAPSNFCSGFQVPALTFRFKKPVTVNTRNVKFCMIVSYTSFDEVIYKQPYNVSFFIGILRFINEIHEVLCQQ